MVCFIILKSYSIVPRELEKREVSHLFINLSRGEESARGRWASGASMDGEGEFQYFAEPYPFADAPSLKPAPPSIHATPPML
jgi:Mn-containing catalase